MARVTNQMKSGVSLICALIASIAFGVASRRFDQPAGRWIMPACFGCGAFFLQFFLIFLTSKEEAELSEYKRLQSARMVSDAARIENITKIANAATERAQSEIQSGNLEEAEKWSDFGRRHHGQ